MNGPLAGLRVIEFAGIGPVPFATMLLADMGAEVLRIDRVGGGEWPELPVISRGRASLALDLKAAADVETCLAAIERADVLIEGFRPGVMERLGLGPEVTQVRNPRLVYGRMTGWGQSGPLASTAGHDINYIAVAGALALLGGASSPPAPPLNLLGDYAGGSLYLVHGILAALLERHRSGLGQVVDAAIIDGVASLLAPIVAMEAAGIVDLDRRRNMLGGVAAPHYRCYDCADNKRVAIGPLEPRFRRLLSEGLGLEPDALDAADDPLHWERLTVVLTERLRTRTRDEWTAIFADGDACLSPVLEPEEAARHPQLADRGTIACHEGVLEPGVAPRLSRTPGGISASIPSGTQRLANWGVVR